MTHNIGQPARNNQDDTVRQVSTLELFFDLVFVFTLTQLTHLLAEQLNSSGIVQVLLIFGVSWWMYGGYAWLTNHLPLTPAGAPAAPSVGDGCIPDTGTRYSTCFW